MKAALLVENCLDLIKQVLVKHTAAVLEEMRDQIVSRNDRIKHLESQFTALIGDKDEYCKVLRVLGMTEDGSPVEEILEREKITDELRELLRIEYLRHGAIETPWICVEADCPRSGKSVLVTGCNCKLDFEMRHIAEIKKELGL